MHTKQRTLNIPNIYIYENELVSLTLERITIALRNSQSLLPLQGILEKLTNQQFVIGNKP